MGLVTDDIAQPYIKCCMNQRQVYYVLGADDIVCYQQKKVKQ